MDSGLTERLASIIDARNEVVSYVSQEKNIRQLCCICGPPISQGLELINWDTIEHDEDYGGFFLLSKDKEERTIKAFAVVGKLTNKSDDIYHLSLLCKNKDVQGKGYGGLLLMYVLAVLFEHHEARGIFFKSTTNAVEFYRKLNFKPPGCSTWETFSEIPKGEHPTINMYMDRCIFNYMKETYDISRFEPEKTEGPIKTVEIADQRSRKRKRRRKSYQ